MSAAIQRHVESQGFSIIRSLVGHGIGRDMHEDPQIPNYGEPGKGPELEPGMVLAIEPMVNAGGPGRPGRRRQLGRLLGGRLAGRPLRVHRRRDRGRAPRPDSLARGVKPLAVHGGVAGTGCSGSVAGGWAAFEVVLAIRARGGSAGHRDRSVIPLTFSILGGLALGRLAARSGDLALPGPGMVAAGCGLAMFAAGLALRAWAVHELGRFFKFTVVVQAGHRVVDSGPYG